MNYYIEKCETLIESTKKKQKNLNILFPNFNVDATLLDWVGVSFGEDDTYCIGLSIKKLAENYKAKELRFWGKILTKNGDYYVAEGVTSDLYADTVPANAEKKGEGANYYSYFVTHDFLEDWFELPLITPE